MKTFWRTFLASIASLAVCSVIPAQADDPGQFEYLNSCASCHGADASGQGSMAEYLNLGVPDLTGLSARNGGQFPMLEVLNIIDGRTCRPATTNKPCPRPDRALAAHGRDMPLWGNRYKDEAVFGDGLSAPSDNPEIVVLGRILALAYFLESIQE